MHTRSFLAHLKRALTTPTLYICILLYAAMLLGTTLGYRTQSSTVMRLLMDAQQDFCRILATVIPAMAYAVTYVDDYNNKLVHHWTVRSGVRSYAVSYYLVSMLSAFVVSFVGCVLFILVMRLRGYPLDRDVISNVMQTDLSKYSPWYLKGYVGVYIAVGLSEYALGCAAMAGFAAACSAMLHRKISAVVVPVLYFYTDQILNKLAKYVPLLKKILYSGISGKMQLSQLVGPSYMISDLYPFPMLNFLFKLLLFALFAIMFGTITIWKIERSVENA